MNEYKCNICKKLFNRYPSQVRNPKTISCSKKCQAQYYKTFIGDKNPNFNNEWTQEQKINQSILIRSKVSYEYRKKCSLANKGKKFSVSRIKKMHENRTKFSYSHPHTQPIKDLIGKKSKEKFTPFFKNKLRIKNEALGYWIPLKEKEDYILYRELSNWIEKMFNLTLKGTEKLNRLGVFNVYSNTSGVVRDHIFSRRSGFNKGVFPEIIRHPCNCQFLTHSENVRKKKSKYTDADSITLEELFSKIRSFKKDWTEQDKCVRLIKKYESGERYNRHHYEDNFYDTNVTRERCIR